MKHMINLYHASLQPERQLLTTARVALLALLVLVIMLVWRIGLSASQQSVNAEQARITAAQAEQRSALAELNSELGRRQLDRALAAEVQRLEQEVAGRRALLQEFARRGEIQRVNYTPLLRELAEIHLDGLWLTRIQISARGIELQGRTQNAALIPRWMTAFEGTETLSPYTFSVVELRRDNSDVLNFALVSRGSASDPLASFQQNEDSEEDNQGEDEPTGGDR